MLKDMKEEYKLELGNLKKEVTELRKNLKEMKI